ncbi:MAG: STAS/SEC14 domain-containing protein [Myxococcales bacterium]|nr:STAS/SEC14 domain-containing protein [Myxococcales bacterium]
MSGLIAVKRHGAPVVHSDGFTSPKGWFRLAGHDDGVVDIEFGPGSVEAAQALIATYHAWLAKMPPGQSVHMVCDVASVDRAPLRVRMMVGKWLLGERKRLGRVAVSGAGLFQMTIVTAVLRVARIGAIRFFMTRDDAIDWIGLPD